MKTAMMIVVCMVLVGSTGMSAADQATAPGNQEECLVEAQALWADEYPKHAALDNRCWGGTTPDGDGYFGCCVGSDKIGAECCAWVYIHGDGEVETGMECSVRN